MQLCHYKNLNFQGFERYHPESEYTLTRYDVEFSPARDGKEHCVELFVDEVEKSGWKISILGSKQVHPL